jgi:hypothetical protein
MIKEDHNDFAVQFRDNVNEINKIVAKIKAKLDAKLDAKCRILVVKFANINKL